MPATEIGHAETTTHAYFDPTNTTRTHLLAIIASNLTLLLFQDNRSFESAL